MPRSLKNSKNKDQETHSKTNTRATTHLAEMSNQEESDFSGSEQTTRVKEKSITNKNLFDMLQKMSVDMEDLKAIKKTTASVEEKLSGLVNRIIEVETRVSGIEDTLAKQRQNPAVTKDEWRFLQDKIASLEDRSRRNNLRFVGFSEGLEQKDTVGFLKLFITTALGLAATTQEGFEIERVHRIQARRPVPSERPRTIIAAFLRYEDSQTILRTAREKQRIAWEGKQIMIFPDYSRETQEKRDAFRQCKRTLHELGIKFRLLYPAMLTIYVGDGPPQTFKDPQRAMDFIQRL